MKIEGRQRTLTSYPRKIIHWIDRLAAKRRGIYAFSQDPACLLRLRRTTARHDLNLPDGVIVAGAPVVEIHLWNEHMLQLSQDGRGGIAFGNAFLRGIIHSFQGIARAMLSDPQLANAQAVGCNLIFLFDENNPERVYQAGRLGFTYLPHRRPLGAFGEFWENLYAWGLMWAYNPESLAGRRFFGSRRSEIWMSRQVFLDRYARPG